MRLAIDFDSMASSKVISIIELSICYEEAIGIVIPELQTLQSKFPLESYGIDFREEMGVDL